MDFVKPDYDNCLVNLSNSILKAFGVETTAPTLEMADKLLDGSYKNVVLLLMDAMGVAAIEKHLAPDGFLRSHLAGSFSSVFPPTTVAATTSVMSGLYPNEHGWLGWDMFFPELEKNVTVFLNCNQLVEDKDGNIIEPEPAAEYHAAFRYFPYKNIIDKINEAGGKAYFSMPFMEPYPGDLDSILKRVEDLCAEPGNKFIYSYWNQPDTTMHEYGPDSDTVHELMISLEKRLEEFSLNLKDTLLLITADHGHMTSINHCITDYPEITKCLLRMPSVEPRALSFFVKDEYKDAFPEIFRSTFKDKFALLTKEEVISQRLFGMGKDNPRLRDSIGDYLAISIADESVFATHKEASLMPGGHAGLTKAELEIPLIAVHL